MSTTADDPLRGGYWYLDTAVEVTADLPCVLTPNVRLERATAVQVATLERKLPRSPSIFGFHGGKADKVLPSKRPDGATEYHRTPLPQDQWRHFVLTYKGGGADIYDLQKLCLVADPPFGFSHFVMTTDEYGVGQDLGWGGDSYSTQDIAEVPCEPLPTITTDTIVDIQVTLALLREISTTYPEVPRALQMLHGLRIVPPQSTLYVLGLFAILEMLLTHQPSNRENADSLRHQLSTKMPLIDRRVPQPFNYSVFAEPGEPARLWKKLYDYRSAVAHGLEPDFAKELRALQNVDVVRKFVHQACRSLLRHALNEPLLYRDLRAV